MSAITSIAWADHTYNPWIGCTKVSPGCDHCYAEAKFDKRLHRVAWGGDRSRTKTARDVAAWDRAARQAGIRRRVFCASLADAFDNQVPEIWRAELWALIDRCRALDWLLLTKRPQNIANMLPTDWQEGWPHVWLGTTVENQIEADRRLPILLRIPASVHFASAEPLLEPIDIQQYLVGGLGWVIVGGESGRNCRTFLSEWARSLRDQCHAASRAFFMKQLGGWPNKHEPHDLPSDLRIRELPR